MGTIETGLGYGIDHALEHSVTDGGIRLQVMADARKKYGAYQEKGTQ